MEMPVATPGNGLPTIHLSKFDKKSPDRKVRAFFCANLATPASICVISTQVYLLDWPRSSGLGSDCSTRLHVVRANHARDVGAAVVDVDRRGRRRKCIGHG